MKIKASHLNPKLGDYCVIGIDGETHSFTKGHKLSNKSSSFGCISQREDSSMSSIKFVVERVAKKMGYELEYSQFENKEDTYSYGGYRISLYLNFRRKDSGYMVHKEDLKIPNMEFKEDFFGYIKYIATILKDIEEEYKKSTVYEEKEIEL